MVPWSPSGPRQVFVPSPFKPSQSEMSAAARNLGGGAGGREKSNINQNEITKTNTKTKTKTMTKTMTKAMTVRNVCSSQESWGRCRHPGGRGKSNIKHIHPFSHLLVVAQLYLVAAIN